MSAFRIEFVPSAAKDFRHLEAALKMRTIKAFEAIRLDPLCGKPLQGAYAGLRSYRVGDYRIVYRPDPPARSILLYRIGHRRDVYQH